jgi:hypothetical protein
MTPEDLARARDEAVADLFELYGMSETERRELGEWIGAADPMTDGKECQHGGALADELREL